MAGIADFLGPMGGLFGQGNMSPGGLAGQLGAAAGMPGGPGAMAGALAGGQQPMGPMAALMQNPGMMQMMQAKMGQMGGMPPGMDPKMMAAQHFMGQGQGQGPQQMMNPGMMTPQMNPANAGMGMPRTPRMGGGNMGYAAQGGGVQPRRIIGGY